MYPFIWFDFHPLWAEEHCATQKVDADHDGKESCMQRVGFSLPTKNYIYQFPFFHTYPENMDWNSQWTNPHTSWDLHVAMWYTCLIDALHAVVLFNAMGIYHEI